MHACLNVDEIVRRIAWKLIAPRAVATTVALARCHRAFEDPVLDELWEIQNHLLPLLKILPADVWNEGGCTVSMPIAHFYLPQLFGLKSPSNDSRRHRNGLASGSMLEGCEGSDHFNFRTSCVWKCFRFCSFELSTNPCFRIWKLLTCGALGNPSHSSPCSFPRGPPSSGSRTLSPASLYRSSLR